MKEDPFLKHIASIPSEPVFLRAIGAPHTRMPPFENKLLQVSIGFTSKHPAPAVRDPLCTSKGSLLMFST